MNNEAKYDAILASLRVARALGVKNLRLRFDSKLIVGQITNEYEAKEERMKKYLQLMRQLIDKFDNVKLELKPREENSAVDNRFAHGGSDDPQYWWTVGLYDLETKQLDRTNHILH